MDLCNAGCSRFKSFVFNHGLNDLGFKGPKYTWRRLVFINDSIEHFLMIVGKWTLLTLWFVIYTN